MSKATSKTYIYLLAQFDDSGEIMFSESFKIGKANCLKQRFNQEYKNNTGYIHPKYIRVLEINTDHNAPDKKLHGFIDFICNPEYTKIKRKSADRELYQFIDQESIDWFDKLCDFTGCKYYKVQSEIDQLLNIVTVENNDSDCIIDDICEKTINYMVYQVIAENSDNSDNSENTVDNTKFMVDLTKKAMSKNPPRSIENGKKYLGPTNINRVILQIDNFSDFSDIRCLVEINDKENILKELKVVLDKLPKSDKFSRAIINCIIKMYK